LTKLQPINIQQLTFFGPFCNRGHPLNRSTCHLKYWVESPT